MFNVVATHYVLKIVTFYIRNLKIKTFPALSQFSALFHNFLASFPQKEQKHTLQPLEHS